MNRRSFTRRLAAILAAPATLMFGRRARAMTGPTMADIFDWRWDMRGSLFHRALVVTGPVVLYGFEWSATETGISYDRTRLLGIPGVLCAHAEPGADAGCATIDWDKVPSDRELSRRWGIPAACDVPVPAGIITGRQACS